mmetsp:Transcript_488/g.1394  ORF Transcript_488/g.1394 Transcript_488/m.1394 type:complete len:225 (-) Transcript_488:1529-2203(-)
MSAMQWCGTAAGSAERLTMAVSAMRRRCGSLSPRRAQSLGAAPASSRAAGSTKETFATAERATARARGSNARAGSSEWQSGRNAPQPDSCERNRSSAARWASACSPCTASLASPLSAAATSSGGAPTAASAWRPGPSRAARDRRERRPARCDGGSPPCSSGATSRWRSSGPASASVGSAPSAQRLERTEMASSRTCGWPTRLQSVASAPGCCAIATACTADCDS